MFTMTQKELSLFELQQELNALKIQVRNCEKWVDYGKDTILKIQDLIDEMEEKDENNESM